jgi:tRNA threonylcarbamoyladenosine biosynthesis protein TsaB
MNTGVKKLTKLLAIDTSTAHMTIALMDGEILLGESSQRVERDHSSKLVPAVQGLLSSLDLTFQDIDGIAAGQGPGSYTGVRIGVTVAKTLAWTLQIPLIGISSLEALAYGAVDEKLSAGTEKQWIIPLMDARRGQVYSALYEAGQNHWSCGLADRIRLMQDWNDLLLEELAARADIERQVRIDFVGEVGAAEEQFARIKAAVPMDVQMLERDMQAYDLGRLAQYRWLQGEQEEVHRFVPNYTQLAEAEAKLLAKRK